MALSAVMIPALALVAGCSGRPSAEDYDAYAAALREDGYLRTETKAADAYYDRADLVRNFERIALHHEVEMSELGSEDNWSENPLARWVGPLNYSLSGYAVTEEDRTETARLMKRIAGLTGLEIIETDKDTNFWITITTPGERGDFSELLASSDSGMADTFDMWRFSDKIICYGTYWESAEESHGIDAALVVIGSETRGLMRESCLHEEIVQVLGLANDHPKVRPSIFNDDEEFALLTEHDENLLRILFDPRLEPGMTAEEAIPIVRQIAAEIPIAPPVTIEGVPVAPKGTVASGG
jgi:hypothetical protein